MSSGRARADVRLQTASPQQQAPPPLTCFPGPDKHLPVAGQRRTLSLARSAYSAASAAGSR